MHKVYEAPPPKFECGKIFFPDNGLRLFCGRRNLAVLLYITYIYSYWLHCCTSVFLCAPSREFSFDIHIYIHYTSSTAQGGGGSFKNRKPIGEVGCCESGMGERSHWWTERCLRSRLFLSLFLYLSLIIYPPTYWSSCLSIYLSLCLSISLCIYLAV
jgi:hypothetical protein